MAEIGWYHKVLHSPTHSPSPGCIHQKGSAILYLSLLPFKNQGSTKAQPRLNRRSPHSQSGSLIVVRAVYRVRPPRGGVWTGLAVPQILAIRRTQGPLISWIAGLMADGLPADIRKEPQLSHSLVSPKVVSDQTPFLPWRQLD